MLNKHIALFKYFKRTEGPPSSKLTKDNIKQANESIAKALETKAGKLRKAQKYNAYTPGQRVLLGKYAAKHGSTAAAIHYSQVWNCSINESTARRLKGQYLEKVKEITPSLPSISGAPVPEVTALTTKAKGRPLLLGKSLDDLVKELVTNLRISGCVVNMTVVMAGAKGIVLSRDPSKLQSHRRYLNITKSWAKSFLIRMGFVKRKCSTAGKVLVEQFHELKEVFLADVTAEVLINNIPDELIFNWDQTSLSIIPTGEWTMEKRDEKVVKLDHLDDKRQITDVFMATLAGEYFPPQLIYKGKTSRCHPQLTFPEGWDIWHTENRWSNKETMRRYIERIVIPFIARK